MTKLITLSNLGTFANEIKSKYAKQSALDALQVKVNELVTAGGEPNKLEGKIVMVKLRQLILLCLSQRLLQCFQLIVKILPKGLSND